MLVIAGVADQRRAPGLRADFRLEHVGGDDHQVGRGDGAVFRLQHRLAVRRETGMVVHAIVDDRPAEPLAQLLGQARSRRAIARRPTAEVDAAVDAQPVDGVGHAGHVGFRGQLAVDVHARRAGQGHLEHAGHAAATSCTVSAAAKTQRGVKDAVAAARRIAASVAAAAEIASSKDHRQADHVVAVRVVVGENLGGRLRLGGRGGSVSPPDELALPAAAAASTRRPAGYRPTFRNARLANSRAFWRRSHAGPHARANSERAGKKTTIAQVRLVVIWRSRVSSDCSSISSSRMRAWPPPTVPPGCRHPRRPIGEIPSTRHPRQDYADCSLLLRAVIRST